MIYILLIYDTINSIPGKSIVCEVWTHRKIDKLMKRKLFRAIRTLITLYDNKIIISISLVYVNPHFCFVCVCVFVCFRSKTLWKTQAIRPWNEFYRTKTISQCENDEWIIELYDWSVDLSYFRFLWTQINQKIK